MPRTRTSIRFLKWTGLIATASIIGIWLGSAFVHVHYDDFDGRTLRYFRLWHGSFHFGRTRDRNITHPDGWWLNPHSNPSIRWWLRGQSLWPAFDQSGLGWYELPLWIPALAIGAPTLLLFGVDRRARRRMVLGHCRKCGYDISATAVETPCPECGAKARLREV